MTFDIVMIRDAIAKRKKQREVLDSRDTSSSNKNRRKKAKKMKRGVREGVI